MSDVKKNWYLDHRSDDLRGWPVLDANGALIGEVANLLVDTGSGYITTVVLLGGRKLLAHELQIGDGVLTMIAPPPVARARRDDGDDLVVQLLDEDFEVGKRTYEAGGVHLEAHTISEPITREVTLHEERVTVARNQVDRVLDANDANRLFHDQTYEVTTTAEVPVVDKFAHVVEEIVIKKRAYSHDETVRDTVRHMEADITDLQGARR